MGYTPPADAFAQKLSIRYFFWIWLKQNSARLDWKQTQYYGYGFSFYWMTNPSFCAEFNYDAAEDHAWWRAIVARSWAFNAAAAAAADDDDDDDNDE